MSKLFCALLAAALLAAAPARAGSALTEGEYVLAPLSFTRFCLDYPAECPGLPARAHRTAEGLRLLEAVNREVNAAIAPRREPPGHAWRLGVASGDCNAFAVRKRHELIARGWPAGALSLAVVETPQGEGHLVVTALTDEGDYVLDNLRASVVDWRRTGYRWIMRQSARDPRYWVALSGARAPPPGS